MILRAWKGSIFVGACLATGAVAVALVIHGTVRDAWHSCSLIFYATPWPVLFILSGLLAWYWAKHGQRAISGILALVGIVMLGLWFQQGWRWTTTLPQGRGTLRAVQWNVDRPNWRFPGDVRWLAAQDADIITIAEREPRKKDQLARWAAAFPAYHLVPSAGEMLCLIRGEVLSVQSGVLDDNSYGTLIRARIGEHEVSVLQVDISASPLANRSKPLRDLAEFVGAHRQENLLMAGDFNTPLESAFFPAIRVHMTNAFEAVGRGCAATWPRPVPVLSLDQMWTNPGLRAVRCEHYGSWRSDHRAMIAEFDFISAPAGADKTR